MENKLGTVIRINESSLLILEFKTFYGVPVCILLYRNCFDVDIFHFSGFSLSQTVLTSYCTFYFTMVKYFPNLPIYNERWLLFSYNSPIFKIGTFWWKSSLRSKEIQCLEHWNKNTFSCIFKTTSTQSMYWNAKSLHLTSLFLHVHLDF